MTLEDRVLALEKSARRWRRCAMALLLCAIVGGTTAATQEKKVPKVIQARKFEVVGKDGRPRGRFEAWALGATLELRNDKRHLTTLLGHADNGAGFLKVCDKQGREMVFFSSDLEGSGFLRLYGWPSGRKTRPMVAMGRDSRDGGGLVYVYNKTGEIVCAMKADAYGRGFIAAMDRKGKGPSLKPK